MISRLNLQLAVVLMVYHGVHNLWTCNHVLLQNTICFLQEIEDAQKIRKSVMNCFEKAALPNLSDDERRKAVHFIVIGGGPTGVEFAAELHDFVSEDLAKLYPNIRELVKISLIEAGDHILTM